MMCSVETKRASDSLYSLYSLSLPWLNTQYLKHVLYIRISLIIIVITSQSTKLSI